jgi:Domain of unknown function (DUF4214)
MTNEEVAMNSLRSLLSRGSDKWEPSRSHPQLEELEKRHLPSAASFAVASGIVYSAENYSNFITNEYQALLGRTPDATGLQFWLTNLEQGMAPEAVEAGIASSAEFQTDYNNDAATWLTGLYNDILRRAPDAAGFSYWMNALQSGATPYQVALGFSTSPEREAMDITADYYAFLGRARDANGMAYWLSVEQQGGTRANVEAGIIGSDEFFANQGDDPTEFITAAYQAVLNRTPDCDEVAYWLGVYDSNS